MKRREMQGKMRVLEVAGACSGNGTAVVMESGR